MNILALLKGLLQSEPARFISYGTVAALTLANAAAHQLGYTALPDGIANGITILVTALLTEVIRRVVYAPDTVGTLVVTAADSGLDPASYPQVDTDDTTTF